MSASSAAGGLILPDTYTTQQGDLWDIISYNVYGDEGYIGLLIQANPAHARTTVFGANITLTVPDIPAAAVSENLPPWVRARG